MFPDADGKWGSASLLLRLWTTPLQIALLMLAGCSSLLDSCLCLLSGDGSEPLLRLPSAALIRPQIHSLDVLRLSKAAEVLDWKLLEMRTPSDSLGPRSGRSGKIKSEKNSNERFQVVYSPIKNHNISKFPPILFFWMKTVEEFPTAKYLL